VLSVEVDGLFAEALFANCPVAVAQVTLAILKVAVVPSADEDALVLMSQPVGNAVPIELKACEYDVPVNVTCVQPVTLLKTSISTAITPTHRHLKKAGNS
jgi:hypothetical protein